MSISSISSNTAALIAQQNIDAANTATTNEVAALSSGNRITQASTDVASLSIGTALGSQVNVLNTALTNASQASSLLQVADGALTQIQAILQQQQSVATQAAAGSLSSTQLGFLNEEFQALTAQINNLAASTNFNGVSLINGNIAGGNTATTNVGAGNANTATSITIGTVAATATAGDTFTVAAGNGPATTLTFGTTAGTIAAGGSVTSEAANIAAALNDSGNPQLADFRFSNTAGAIKATYIGTAGSLPNSGASPQASLIPTITTTSSNSGGISGAGAQAFSTTAGSNGATAIITLSAVVAGNTVTINGSTFTALANGGTNTSTSFAIGTSTQTTAVALASFLNSINTTNTALSGLSFTADATSGAIYAYYNGANSPTITTSAAQGTGASAPTVSGAVTNLTVNTDGSTGLAAGTTEAIGTANGNLFVTGGSNNSSASDYGQAVNLLGVYGNSAFTGSFGGSGNIGAIQANYDAGATSATSGVTFSTVVGGVTYTSAEVLNSTLNATATGSDAITFTGNNTATGAAQGGSFTLNIQGGQSYITNQTQATNFANALNGGLSSVSAYQNRQVTNFNNGYAATVGGTTTGTLQGATLTFNSNNFSSPLISSVTVSTPGAGQTDATIQAVVNGQTYSTIAGVGDIFKTDSEIVLENTSNPAQQLILTTGNVSTTGTYGSGNTAIDLSSASNASAFQTALSNALGLNSGNAALSFQVGSSTNSTIGVSIGSATSSALFGGQSLDVLTSADATTASNAVGTALNTVTAIIANVGALENQFNYASNAVSSAVQNEGAAKSSLLDTDVAATSTSFATSQVQLQAGIAVLAQANQLSQNLLKLIA